MLLSLASILSRYVTSCTRFSVVLSTFVYALMCATVGLHSGVIRFRLRPPPMSLKASSRIADKKIEKSV